MDGMESSPSQDQLKVEKDRVTKFNDALDNRLRDLEDDHKRMARMRSYARGGGQDAVDAEEMDLIDTDGLADKDDQQRPNLIHSTQMSLMPGIAARNPKFLIKPIESTAPQVYELMAALAKTCEIALNLWFKRGRFKKKLRRNCLSTFTTAVGWLKVAYQRNMAEDPLIRARLDDTQNNINEFKQLAREVNDPDASITEDDRLVKLAELQEQAQVLKEQLEIVIAEGFVFDRIRSEYVIVSSNVEELDDYRDADWIADLSFHRVRDLRATFGLEGEEWDAELKRAKVWSAGSDGVIAQRAPNNNQTEDADDDGNPLVCVVERWDRKRQTVFTWIHGGSRWLREPWHPKAQGRQWFPYFPLMFNEVDGDLFPQSDVGLLITLVDEFWETRTALRQHRLRAIPGLIGKRGDITERDAKAINNRKTGELTLIDGSDDITKPADASFSEIRYPPVDPGLYDTTPILQDYDTISGLQDAARGSAIRAKTATEAAIMEQGKTTRQSDRQDMVEDYAEDIAAFVLQMALLRVPHEKIVRMCGPGAVWPQPVAMPFAPLPGQQPPEPMFILADPKTGMQVPIKREDIFDLLNLEIEVGSTGKPEQEKEQSQWMQMLPVLSQQLDQIAMMRAQGLFDLAEAKKRLLQELVNRLDQRLNVESFLPPIPGMMAPGVPAGPPGMMPPGPGGPGGLAAVPPAPGGPAMQTPGDQPPTNLGAQGTGDQPTPPAGPQPPRSLQ